MKFFSMIARTAAFITWYQANGPTRSRENGFRESR